MADYIRLQKNLSIYMTSRGSGAFQAAMAAREMFCEIRPEIRIEVIDPLNVSMCHGWMVIEAARAVLANQPFNDILICVMQMILVTHMLQPADTLKYLYMVGRIGKAKHLVGSLLNINPIVEMDKGMIIPMGTARSHRQAYQMMLEMVGKVVGRSKIKFAYQGHSSSGVAMPGWSTSRISPWWLIRMRKPIIPR